MPGEYDWRDPYPRKEGWQKLGNCNGQDTNKYVPEEDKGSGARYDRTPCETCEVKKECLDYALANHPDYGMWGGTIPREREKMYRHYRGERTYDLNNDYLLRLGRFRNRDCTPSHYSIPSISGRICSPVAHSDLFRPTRSEDTTPVCDSDEQQEE